MTETYQLDLNAGLTQVLSDGPNTYLYGQGRIAQEAGDEINTFLPDGLGSVRDMLGGDEIALVRDYTPYGEVLASAGSGLSAYGYAGEWTDSSGMQYLRARYYAPSVGRFVSRDSWQGNDIVPSSYNAWLYVYGNPINNTDPSGMIPNRQGIEDGTYVYSCHCGWIDFHHAVPSLSKRTLSAIENQPEWPTSRTDLRKDVLGIWVDLNIANIVGYTAVVKTGLSKLEKEQVALGMFMSGENMRETMTLPSIIVPSIPFIGKPSHDSYFAEEDLVSDLIGFYMAKYGKKDVRATGGEETRIWLAGICGFPNDQNEARDWSLSIFENYQFTRVFQWESPILTSNKCIDDYCRDSGTRQWPKEFSSVDPEMQSRDGNWRFYDIFRDKPLLPSNVSDVFFLRE